VRKSPYALPYLQDNDKVGFCERDNNLYMVEFANNKLTQITKMGMEQSFNGAAAGLREEFSMLRLIKWFLMEARLHLSLLMSLKFEFQYEGLRVRPLSKAIHKFKLPKSWRKRNSDVSIMCTIWLLPQIKKIDSEENESDDLPTKNLCGRKSESTSFIRTELVLQNQIGFVPC